jgi:hypothetical protein
MRVAATAVWRTCRGDVAVSLEPFADISRMHVLFIVLFIACH